MKKIIAILILVSLASPTLAYAVAPDPSTVQPLPTDSIQQSADQITQQNTQQQIQALAETGQTVGCSNNGSFGGALANNVGAALQRGIVRMIGSLGRVFLYIIASQAGPFGVFINTAGNILLNKGLTWVNNQIATQVNSLVNSITGGVGQQAISQVAQAVGVSATQAAQAAFGAATGAAGTAVGTAVGAGVGVSVPVSVIADISNPAIEETRSTIVNKVQPDVKRASDATELLTYKECVADPLQAKILNSILANSTRFTFDFINSGFDGQPAFTRSIRKLSKDITRAVLEDVEDRILSGICSPQRDAVKIAVLTQYQYQTNIGRRTQCATDEGEEARRVEGDFVGGGGLDGMYRSLWNPGGGFAAFPNALSVTSEAQQEALNEEFKMLDWNDGWKSKVDCTSDADAHAININGSCIGGKVVLPGSIIRDQASEATDRANQQLLTGDEIGEILDSLMYSIEQVVFQSIDGLFTLSERSSSGRGSYLDRMVGQDAQASTNTAQNALAADIQGSAHIERAYGETLKLIAGDFVKARDTYTQAIACYQPLVNGGSLNVSSQMAIDAVAHASSTIRTTIAPQLRTLNTQIADSDSALVMLEALRARAQNATAIPAITQVTNEYNQLINSGLVHNATDIQYLENDLIPLAQALEQLLLEANTMLRICRGQV